MTKHNELLKRSWAVEFRDLVVKTRQIDAWKVEGWSNDYAFYDSDNKVFLLIPREIVASVACIWTFDQAADRPKDRLEETEHAESLEALESIEYPRSEQYADLAGLADPEP